MIYFNNKLRQNVLYVNVYMKTIKSAHYLRQLHLSIGCVICVVALYFIHLKFPQSTEKRDITFNQFYNSDAQPFCSFSHMMNLGSLTVPSARSEK